MCRAYLENQDIGVSIWSFSAAVDSDVFEPLDVRLWVTEHSAHKLHITADNCSLISWQTGLQDRSVRRTFCSREIQIRHKGGQCVKTNVTMLFRAIETELGVTFEGNYVEDEQKLFRKQNKTKTTTPIRPPPKKKSITPICKSCLVAY